MKRIFQFRNANSMRLNLVVLMIAILVNSCQKTDEDPEDTCGTAEQWYTTLSIDDDFTTSEILSGGRITYYFEDINTPEDICSDNHVTCIWSLEPINQMQDTAFLTIKGKAYWKGLQGQETTLAWDDNRCTDPLRNLALKWPIRAMKIELKYDKAK